MAIQNFTADQLATIRSILAEHIELLHDECKIYDGTEEGDFYRGEFHHVADTLRAVADAAKALPAA